MARSDRGSLEKANKDELGKRETSATRYKKKREIVSCLKAEATDEKKLCQMELEDYGRGLWICENVSPLREQIGPKKSRVNSSEQHQRKSGKKRPIAIRTEVTESEGCHKK